jgi:hypothetical protein
MHRFGNGGSWGECLLNKAGLDKLITAVTSIRNEIAREQFRYMARKERAPVSSNSFKTNRQF